MPGAPGAPASYRKTVLPEAGRVTLRARGPSFGGTRMRGTIGVKHHIKGKEKTLCSACDRHYRYLYTLANKSIVLYCNGCLSIWTNSEKIGWDEAASEKMLQEELGGDIPYFLIIKKGIGQLKRKLAKATNGEVSYK